MKSFQVDGQWFVEVSGGYRNNDDIASSKKQVSEKPEPLVRWKEKSENSYGTAYSEYTQFQAGGENFTIEEYCWNPAHGYCWSEAWEGFSNATIPKLGEAWEWTGQGWEAISHPMAIES